MRIYVDGISTETNTFSPVRMDIAQFKKGFYFLRKEIGIGNVGEFMIGSNVDHGYNTRATVKASIQQIPV